MPDDGSVGEDVQRLSCQRSERRQRETDDLAIVRGPKAIAPFKQAFEDYWENDKPSTFGKTRSAKWQSLGLDDIDAKIAFSPHSKANALLESIGDDLNKGLTSSLLYSLAFLYQTPGVIKKAIAKATKNDKIFVYGISDRKVGGIVLRTPTGNVAPVFPTALEKKNTPEPFKSEPTGGGGNRMHHKFLVVDFDKPSARVYLGSYNFSKPADGQNGENLVLIRDRRIATSYMIEALRIFDHYHFRVLQKAAKSARKKLFLAKPPRKRGEKAWWLEDYTNKRRIRDRELFA